MRTIYTERIMYGGNRRIKLSFIQVSGLVESLRGLPDFRWSPMINAYHIEHIDNHIEYLNGIFRGRYRFVEKAGGLPPDPSSSVMVHYQESPSDDRIYLKFNYNPKMIELVRTFQKPYWHDDLKLWSIKGGKESLMTLLTTMLRRNYRPIASRIYTPVKRNAIRRKAFKHTPILPERFINYLVLSNYSARSIQTYGYHIIRFLGHWDQGEIPSISSEQLNSYIWDLVSINNYSRSYQNQVISAIKLYYRIMTGKHLEAGAVPRPKKSKKLPVVLSRKEITDLIRSIRNPKHRMVIMLIYSTGIRLAESVNLRIEDIDFHRKLIHIRGGKGKKDRVVPLAGSLISKLEEYLKTYRPKQYLVEGQKGGIYSTRSVQNVLKAALKRTGIQKNASVHSLRHSFATHTLEDGTDIRLIQEILGHTSLRTTEIYTHISQANILRIKSPIDKLDL